MRARREPAAQGRLFDPDNLPAPEAVGRERSPSLLRFSGATYDAAQDQARLSSEYWRVFGLMADGRWRTLQEISAVTGAPEAAVSARLRDCRKRRFGGHTVLAERIPAACGLWRYRLICARQTTATGT